MPSGGGGGDTSATVYTNLIPTYIPGMQAMAVSYLTEATTLALNNFVAYTGPTYAPQNINEIDGIVNLAVRGEAGSSVEADGEIYLRNVLGGNYLAANSYRDAALQQALNELLQSLNEDVLPRILDAHAFAFGGSEHNIEEAKAAEKTMDAINALNEKIYYDDYRIERRIQDAALSHATPYGQRGIRDGEMLRSAGVFSREYLQAEYNDLWAQWNEDIIIPVRNLDLLGNAVRSILGTVRNQTTDYYKPPAITQIAGLALTGMSIYSLFNKTTLSAYDGKKRETIITDTRKQNALDVESFVTPRQRELVPQITNEPTTPQTSNISLGEGVEA